MHYMTLCGVFKDEAPNLLEWVTHHHLLGADHFYLVNHGSTDNWREVLHKFLAAGKVTVVNCTDDRTWPFSHHAPLEWGRKNTRWMGFNDIDEFYIPDRGWDLKRVLGKFEKYDALATHWMCFGSNGWQKRSRYIAMEAYTTRPRVDFMSCGIHTNNHVKCIVNPARITSWQDPHMPNGLVVDTAYGLVKSAYGSDPVYPFMRLNHYFTRSWEEWVRKVERGRGDIHEKRDLRQEWDDYHREVVDDPTALRYVPQVEAEMERWK